MNKIGGVRGPLFKNRHFWPKGLDIEALKDEKSVKGTKVKKKEQRQLLMY